RIMTKRPRRGCSTSPRSIISTVVMLSPLSAPITGKVAPNVKLGRRTDVQPCRAGAAERYVVDYRQLLEPPHEFEHPVLGEARPHQLDPSLVVDAQVIEPHIFRQALADHRRHLVPVRRVNSFGD